MPSLHIEIHKVSSAEQTPSMQFQYKKNRFLKFINIEFIYKKVSIKPIVSDCHLYTEVFEY